MTSYLVGTEYLIYSDIHAHGYLALLLLTHSVTIASIERKKKSKAHFTSHQAKKVNLSSTKKIEYPPGHMAQWIGMNGVLSSFKAVSSKIDLNHSERYKS